MRSSCLTDFDWTFIARENRWISPPRYLPVIEAPAGAIHRGGMVQHPTPSSLAIAVVLVKLALVAPVALTTIAAGAGDQAVTLTGCLTAGPEKGTFILTTTSGNVAV